MERKKWTPKAEITAEILKFREKRKWQLAFRRYVLEKYPSPAYGFYFGLSINQFRNWIEIQFTESLNWENFGTKWQFDHIVPVAYFDFSLEEDLLICWNFINIRIETIDQQKKSAVKIDVIAARLYFNQLYKSTNYSFCLKMINKINKIEVSGIRKEPKIEAFIINNLQNLSIISTLGKEEFNSLNEGMSLDDILIEREIIKKYG